MCDFNYNDAKVVSWPSKKWEQKTHQKHLNFKNKGLQSIFFMRNFERIRRLFAEGKTSENTMKICLTGIPNSNKHDSENTSMGVPQSFAHMKRIAVSAGLVALGVTAVQADSYSLGSTQSSKPWSVEAKLRGFYDDNINLTDTDKKDGFGFEIDPRVSLNVPLDQTLIIASYGYTYRYYDNGGGVNLNDSRCTQTHQFDLSLTHSFSERYMVQVTDSFVRSEEPDLGGGTPYIADAYKNNGAIRFSAELTRLLSLVVGYRNAYYNYDNRTLSDLLDRQEHNANIDLRWLLSRNTVGVIGYNFGAVSYIENNPIGGIYTSQDRNNYTHTIYAGVEHTFNPSLQVNARGGAQIVDYYNDPLNADTKVSPWAQANVSYTYSPDGTVTLGFSHARNQTDLFSLNASSATLDEESSTVYLDFTHHITPMLTGSVTGHYQYSKLNGGTYDGDHEDMYGVSVNLSYSFNEHLSTEIGYTYDALDSNTGRKYDRNRVYLGIGASY